MPLLNYAFPDVFRSDFHKKLLRCGIERVPLLTNLDICLKNSPYVTCYIATKIALCKEEPQRAIFIRKIIARDCMFKGFFVWTVDKDV